MQNQLVESRKQLEAIGIQKIDEFVLPYGLYNNQTLEINKKTAKYKYISTCDEYLDSGEQLKPRFLITSDISVKETINKIKRLQPR